MSSCPTNLFSLLPKVILTAPHLSFQQLFFSPGLGACFPASLRGARQTYFPQLNLHNTRVRRNPERLPSSRCIESAQSHRARARILPTRASDTALRLLGSQRDKSTSIIGSVTHPVETRLLIPFGSRYRTLRINFPIPLDEAQGYAALIELQPDTYTRTHRFPSWQVARIRQWTIALNSTHSRAKQAFYEDKLTVAHAFEIARLQPNDQRSALQECLPQYRNPAAILKDKKAEATTARELRAWIERETHLALTNAPFGPQDETLLPKTPVSAGARKPGPRAPRTGERESV